ncbi:MAG TPA: inositol 2-dehydrogenase [Xanthomonadales bacterium]|nr:inositol 2-dehydrogenase [Xanthomonadales bacterium]
MSQQKTTGIAILGAGRIGRIHASNLMQSANAEIRHVVDVSAAAAKDLAERYHARASTVAEALTDPQVDAVVIGTSTDTHAELVQAAARAGKAIFCEKPLDLDIETARESLRVVDETHATLCLGFNRRHDPSFNKLKEEIVAGAVGEVEVVSITSRDPSPPPAEYVGRSGGLFRDMMIHDFDMARWLLGEEPVSVFASGSVLVDPAIGEAGDIDTAVVILRTASGKLAQISNSRRCAYGYDQRIEVFGAKGMVSAGNATETHVSWANKTGVHSEVALPFFLERYADAYRLQLDKFLRLLNGEDVSLPGGADGLQALLIADAAQRSHESATLVAIA